MLRCTMNMPLSLQLGLDDLIAEMRHARRHGDLGRLALIAYCDMRRWARQAGELDIANQSLAMFTDEPHASRDAFLDKVDRLLHALEDVQSRLQSALPAPPPTPRRQVYEPPATCG
jgi:hypothetical protein